MRQMTKMIRPHVTKMLMLDLILAKQLLEQGGKTWSYPEIWSSLRTTLQQFEQDVRLGRIVSQNGDHKYPLTIGKTPIAWFYIT